MRTRRERWAFRPTAGSAIAIAFVLVLGSSLASAGSISLSGLNLEGTSTLISGGVLQLTNNLDPNPLGPPPAGSAWTTSTLNVASPFTVSFDFQMMDPAGHLDNDGSGGDGIAFLIQNSPAGDTALGEGAGGMGFLGISNSVAVMLVTYQNSSPDFYGDPSGNYISVNTQGTGVNVPHHYCMDGILTADLSIGTDVPAIPCTVNPTVGMTGTIPRLLDDGTVQNLMISYVPGSMSIFLDSALVLTVPLDLATTLDLAGGSDAFLGFTAGTRFSYQDQDIVDFSYSNTVPEPSTASGCLGGMALLSFLFIHRRNRRRASGRA